MAVSVRLAAVRDLPDGSVEVEFSGSKTGLMFGSRADYESWVSEARVEADMEDVLRRLACASERKRGGAQGRTLTLDLSLPANVVRFG